MQNSPSYFPLLLTYAKWFTTYTQSFWSVSEYFSRKSINLSYINRIHRDNVSSVEENVTKYLQVENLLKINNRLTFTFERYSTFLYRELISPLRLFDTLSCYCLEVGGLDGFMPFPRHLRESELAVIRAFQRAYPVFEWILFPY